MSNHKFWCKRFLPTLFLSQVGIATVVFFVTVSAVLADQRTPGGIAVIPIPIVLDDGTRPTVRFGRRPVLLLREVSRWLAVIGLARTMLPGEYVLSIGKNKSDAEEHVFRVAPQADAKLPPAPDPDRIQAFKFDAERFATLPLVKPVNGERLRRFTVDFPAEEVKTQDASSVLAAADGIVSDISRAGPTGHRITLDHGQGVHTIMAPVYEVEVKIGDEISQSVRVGVAGVMTAGAVAGIRWQVVLNGVLVDPSLLTLWPSPPEI